MYFVELKEQNVNGRIQKGKGIKLVFEIGELGEADFSVRVRPSGFVEELVLEESPFLTPDLNPLDDIFDLCELVRVKP